MDKGAIFLLVVFLIMVIPTVREEWKEHQALKRAARQHKQQEARPYDWRKDGE